MADQEAAFAELKERMRTTEVLKRRDSSLLYHLTSDSAHKGMGAILSQVDQDGVEHLFFNASRSCNPSANNYGNCEGECLAVVWAVQHFQENLFGQP